VTRLLDMGVEPYLVASSLVATVAQRLVRRICANCAQPYEPRPETLEAIGIEASDLPGGTLMRGAGCDRCQQTGYKGRHALFELFIVDEPIRRLTVDRASSNDMRDHAIRRQGMRTLLGDGRLAVLDGKTSPDEVLRVCQREAL
jgi:type II secretory ATPase GspE/PulE/Tfp pilus assembly ATPase PilB-like protein